MVTASWPAAKSRRGPTLAYIRPTIWVPTRTPAASGKVSSPASMGLRPSADCIISGKTNSAAMKLADEQTVIRLADRNNRTANKRSCSIGVVTRNARARRNEVVFVDPDRQADEPHWAQGGTYLAFVRITQDVTAFIQLPPTEQDRIIGRDRGGRRLDLDASTSVAAEGSFETDTPPADSHVRKAGPRGGPDHDGTQIFRRGLPFYEVTDGRVTQGLHFVSFQASLDQFDAVYGRWMINPNFPHPNAGQDALIARALVTVERWAFFFVPPDSDGPIGTVKRPRFDAAVF